MRHLTIRLPLVAAAVVTPVVLGLGVPAALATPDAAVPSPSPTAATAALARTNDAQTGIVTIGLWDTIRPVVQQLTYDAAAAA